MIKLAVLIFKDTRNNLFSIIYPHEGVPELGLYQIFQKLEELGKSRGIIISSVPANDWAQEIERRVSTNPTRFTSLLSTLSSTLARKNSVQQMSKMEGLSLWLNRLFIKSDAMSVVPLVCAKETKKYTIGFFKLALQPDKVQEQSQSLSGWNYFQSH